MNDALRTPGWLKKYGMVEGGRFTFSSEKQRFISTSFDYAGNVSALMIESGDSFQECIDLTIDTKTLGIGETATLKNVAENDVFTPIVRWTVSDPTVAEIVESGNDFCIVRGIAMALQPLPATSMAVAKALKPGHRPASEALEGKFVVSPVTGQRTRS